MPRQLARQFCLHNAHVTHCKQLLIIEFFISLLNYLFRPIKSPAKDNESLAMKQLILAREMKKFKLVLQIAIVPLHVVMLAKIVLLIVGNQQRSGGTERGKLFVWM